MFDPLSGNEQRSQLLTNLIDRIGNCEYEALEKIDFSMSGDFNWAEQILEQVQTKRNPNKTALAWLDENGKEKKFTYREIVTNGNKFLNALRDNGVQKGDSIFVMLPGLP